MRPAFLQVEAGLPDFSGPVIPSAVDAPAFHLECGEAEQNWNKHIRSLQLPVDRLSRSISLNHTDLSPSLRLASATFYKLLTL
jgi:hypothetical protein